MTSSWPILALALLALSGVASAVPVAFRFVPAAPAERVQLGGTFNGWRTDAHPLVKGEDGAWTATVDLAPGAYEYKFLVNGREWVADPSVTETVPPDGNTPLWVTPDGTRASNRPGDGRLLDFALRHEADDVMRISRNRTRFTLRAAAGDIRTAVMQVWDAEGSVVRRTLPMKRRDAAGILDTFTVETDGLEQVRYSFLLTDGAKSWSYGAGGVTETPGVTKPFRVNVSDQLLLETPDWVRDTVWYQVFPERFHNGDPANDIPPPKGVSDWNTPLTAVQGRPNDFWWGGDLKGITQKIPYLKSLGITGLYLTPVFEGPNTHKYATTDYHKVATEFGAEKDLKALVDTAHANGMRVMLDGVFNHTSVYFPPFRDVIEKQEKSEYATWYHIREFPVLDPVTNYRGGDERKIPYEGWWGIKWMPKLKTTNPETEKYLLDVGVRWIERTGIDGWRLDVANEVSPAFWRKFRKAVKAAKPEVVIIGEIWDDASPWLKGDQFDAVMNYRFRGAVLDFFARDAWDGARFASNLETLYYGYPPQASAVMFNLLGSHDTPRLLTEAGGDARRVALATLFQMTWPGAPSVYYGDEIGMPGATDPYNRAPMVWDESRWDPVILPAVRRAIALRQAHPSLRGTSVKTLYAPAGRRVVAFLRQGGDETAITVFNVSQEEQTVSVPLEGKSGSGPWRDAWRDLDIYPKDGKIELRLPAMSASVLFPENKTR